MIAKIQLIADNGKVIYEQVLDAFQAGGWEAGLGDSPTEGKRQIHGFTYLPVPPPRDPLDVAAFRRLLGEHFGA